MRPYFNLYPRYLSKLHISMIDYLQNFKTVLGNRNVEFTLTSRKRNKKEYYCAISYMLSRAYNKSRMCLYVINKGWFCSNNNKFMYNYFWLIIIFCGMSGVVFVVFCFHVVESEHLVLFPVAYVMSRGHFWVLIWGVNIL